MARRRRRTDLAGVGEILARVYPDAGKLETARVFGWWARAVPARVATHARPVELRRGTLVVHVKSPAWSQELQFLKERLLAKIRLAAPAAGVRDIRFRVGPLPELPSRPSPQAPKRIPAPLTTLPDELGRALARIQDDGLRETIAQAAAFSLGSRTRRSDE